MRLRLFAAVVAALLSSPLFGRQAPTFTEKVEVRVMDLDVSVTDSKGAPITNLQRGDFTVFVDKKAVPIDYFAAVKEGAVHAPDLATLSPDLVLQEYEKGAAAYVPRHFVIFFDSVNTPPAGRTRILDALRDFVIRLGPSDDALLVLYDGRARMIADWTSSKEALLASFDRIARSPNLALNRLLRERETLRQIDSTRGISTRMALARFYAEQSYDAERRLLSELQGTLSLLAGRAGKKILLYVSGGFEFQPGYAMALYAVGGTTSILPVNFNEYDISDPFKKTIRRANDSEITLYTLDARGLIGEGATASNDDPLESRPAVAFAAREDSQAGMKLLAEETGGLALVNTNDFERGLNKVYQDVSTYYSIGVNLKSIAPGGYHDVHVAVDRPGARVRARQGYGVRTEEDRELDRVEATLRTDLAYRDLGISARLLPERRVKKDRIQPIEVQLPARDVAFLPDGQGTAAEVDFFVAVVSDKGDQSQISRVRRTFRLPAGTAPQGETLATPFDLRMKKGNYQIVVNARDLHTGQMGTAKINAHVE